MNRRSSWLHAAAGRRITQKLSWGGRVTVASRGVVGFDAAALRTLRTAAGISQHKLADRVRLHGAQVAGPHICLYECGKRTPQLRTLTALASALEVPPSALLEDDSSFRLCRLRLRMGIRRRFIW
ncbi:helix-turn-helix domain-containing protein [Streptomyces netropsis]|uniref:helix-turn-helix domain-containing protein n=1 Tax=Streptomyces netropsis TaxID=55404 RepID=UPI00379E40DA